MRYFPSLFLLPLVFFSPVPARAQSPSPGDAMQAQEAARQKTEEQEAGEKKVRALLDELASDLSELRLPENRVYLQANLAGILWPRDETRARALFTEAMNSLSELVSGLDPGDPRYVQIMQTPLQVRNDLIQLASQRDPKLALDILRATRMPPLPQGYGQPNSETAQELNLAIMIAAKDPKLAMQIAEEGLAKGVFSQTTYILSNLMNYDREAATTLAGEILKKLRATDLLSDSGIMIAAIGLLNAEQAAQRGAPPGSPGGNKPRPLIGDDASRELIEQMIAAVMAVNANGPQNTQRYGIARNLLSMLQSQKLMVEKYAPSRIVSLQQKAAEFGVSPGARSNPWLELQNLLRQPGNVTAAIGAAEKMPPEMQPQAYQQVAAKAFNEGDTALALQILNEHISDPSQRAAMKASFENQAFWRAATEGKVDEARQFVASRRSAEERAQMLTQLAVNIAQRGDKKVALQLLDEARGMLSARAENYAQMSVRLQIASAYAGLKPSSGFEIIETVPDQLNAIIAAASVLDGFQQGGAFREGEMLLHQGSFFANLVREYAEGLASLARTDLGRAEALIERLQPEEARLLARLLLARGALSQQAERSITRIRFARPLMLQSTVARPAFR